MTHEQEIIWLAGLLEGEGCFRVQTDARSKNKRDTLVVELNMTDRDVVEHASKILPAGNATVRVKPLSTGIDYRGSDRGLWKTSYRIRWNGAYAEKVMRAVLPYMGARRTEKISTSLRTPNLSHTPRKEAV